MAINRVCWLVDDQITCHKLFLIHAYLWKTFWLQNYVAIQQPSEVNQSVSKLNPLGIVSTHIVLTCLQHNNLWGFAVNASLISLFISSIRSSLHNHAHCTNIQRSCRRPTFFSFHSAQRHSVTIVALNRYNITNAAQGNLAMNLKNKLSNVTINAEIVPSGYPRP